jgi:hypothetical protein
VISSIHRVPFTDFSSRTPSPSQEPPSVVEETLVVRNVFAFLYQDSELLLQALEASWLKLFKSAAESVPGTSDRSKDHGQRQHLSERDRFGFINFA